MIFWDHIEKAISEATGQPFVIRDHHAISGGSINEAWQLVGEGRDFFIKTHQAGRLDMFIAEAEGLAEMASSHAIRVPEPVCWGEGEERSYLVMEYLPLSGPYNAGDFGQRLGQMHHLMQDRFGWHRDNTIGATPQINHWETDWLHFWKTWRLGYQLTLAHRNGASRGVLAKGEQLIAEMDGLFPGYQPQASLLHGDLWAGNWGTMGGETVIYDPAVYYGDHEADLAMTELFGHPGKDFWPNYQEYFAIDPGYAVRRNLYNLYHVLNHFNLFGGGYGGQAERMMDKLLAELKG
ncbi:MAG TPA: fructosamine kinase family protein [Gammaproteobacteria bacterium]|nr:fructosamine kinase family protein [Gammaproteobacteria bacterium]